MFAIHPTRYAPAALLAAILLVLTACGGEEATQEVGPASQLPETVFLAEAPQGIQSISSLKAGAKEGDEVVVRVVVGGTENPIVQGRASAAIIDASIENPCLSEDDHCPIPWDYCCTPQENRTANLATLRITDDAGQVLKAELAPRIKPLTTLVIKGIVGPRPDEQVLTIDAQGIYIEDEIQ
ncbi:MAG: hypothetical protein KTR15_00415 [Phycisphaeraceae bacterium]|nr:hypothetical protein [Phycisphaeraceae bacterium]